MRGFPVTVELPVLWGEMDALRHVNNTHYFSWFEAARIAYLGHMSDSFDPVLFTSEIGPILATISCDFLRPVVFPGRVRVGASVVEIGNSSLRMDHAVERTDAPGELCARGTSVLVMIRYATLEKVRVPDSARTTIATLEQRAAEEKAQP